MRQLVYTVFITNNNNSLHLRWKENFIRHQKVSKYYGQDCRCECKNLIDKGICGKGFIWNPSNCECECDKSCDVGEYLDYANCKCRKKLIDKQVEEFSENIDEKELFSNEISDYEKICSSCSVYIILLVTFFILSISISSVFIFFHWYLKKNNTGVTHINPWTETVTYWMLLHYIQFH